MRMVAEQAEGYDNGEPFWDHIGDFNIEKVSDLTRVFAKFLSSGDGDPDSGQALKRMKLSKEGKFFVYRDKRNRPVYQVEHREPSAEKRHRSRGFLFS